MYNTNIVVKYKDIANDLLAKINNSNQDKDDEEGYTEDDVETICERLYHEEFLAVFDAKDFIDDKIDNEMKELKELLYNNDKFNNMVNECLVKHKRDYEKEPKFDITMFKDGIFYSMFSYSFFDTSHKIVCQLMETEDFDETLLEPIKQYII